MSIDELNSMIRKCRRCRLCKVRTNAICGEGNLNAKIMLIAQAPGEMEDKVGRMFVGPSGKVLNELLREVGISRQEIYMTNLIKCMLPKYRKPKQDEIEACSFYLDKEIEIINPMVLVPLGYYATRYIIQKYNVCLPKEMPFSSVYGNVFCVGDKKILPLHHPAVCLYNPDFKQNMMKDYKKLKSIV